MKRMDTTDMGMLKAEIIEYLEGNGPATMAELTRLLQRPTKTVAGIVDALVGEDLVSVTRHEDEVIVRRAVSPPMVTDPEVWGG